MKFSLSAAFVVSFIMTLICYIFINQISAVFLTDKDALDYSIRFARILLTTSSFFGIFFVYTNALQSLGATTASLIVNISRQGLIYIPFLFILNFLFKSDGLMWAQPIADILSLLIAIVLYKTSYKKYTLDFNL